MSVECCFTSQPKLCTAITVNRAPVRDQLKQTFLPLISAAWDIDLVFVDRSHPFRSMFLTLPNM